MADDKNLESKIIEAVLKQVCALLNADPSYVNPDSVFNSELEISDFQVQAIGLAVLESFGVKNPDRNKLGFYQARTPRELVAKLLSCMSINKKSSTAA